MNRSEAAMGDKTDVLKVFHQLLCMGKHMLDEVFPDILLLMDKQSIENLIMICQEFGESLHVFNKLCNVVVKKHASLAVPLQRKEICFDDSNTGYAKPTTEQVLARGMYDKCLEEPDSGGPSDNNDDNKWKLLFKNMEEIIMDKKAVFFSFYCGLCNVPTLNQPIWESHEAGKKHLKRLNEFDCIKMKCDNCGFHMISDLQHVSMVFKSPEHLSVDDKILQTFAGNGPKGIEQSHVDGELADGSSQSSSSNDRPQSENSQQLSTVETANSSDRSSPTLPEPLKSNEPSSNPRKQIQSVRFHGTHITEKFVKWQESCKDSLERNVQYTRAWCLPCDYLAKHKNQWFEHTRTSEHRAKMNLKKMQNFFCACKRCEFGMVACHGIVTDYMWYHVEVCHSSVDKAELEKKYLTYSAVKTTQERESRRGYEGDSSRSSSRSDRPLYDDDKYPGRDSPSFGRSTPNQPTRPDGSTDRLKNRYRDRSGSRSKDFEGSPDSSRSSSRLDQPTCESKTNRSIKEVEFRGIFIRPNFVALMSDLLDGIEQRQSTQVNFCLACCYLAEDKIAWDAHLIDSAHLLKMSRKEFNSFFNSCRQCDFGLIASGRVITAYMCYHIEKVHSQPTEHINIDEYIYSKKVVRKNTLESVMNSAIDNLRDASCSTSTLDEPSSKKSSKKSSRLSKARNSCEDISKLATNSGYDEGAPSSSAQSPTSTSNMSLRSSKEESTIVCNPERPPSLERKIKKSKHQPPTPDTTATADDSDSPIELFIKMLRMKTQSKEDKPFSAFCLLCPRQPFSDAFEFCSHIQTHSSSSNDELECSSCNTTLFGNMNDINNLLALPDHKRVDQLMKFRK